MTFHPRFASVTGFLMAVVVGVAAGLIFTGFFPTVDPSLGWPVLAISVVSFGSAIVSVIISRGRTRTSSRLRLAAAQHGFGFTKNLQGPGFTGLLFREGINVHASDLIDARKSSTPFLAGSLTGQYANDSSSPRVIGASFMMIPLPRSVPNIVLIAKGLGTLRQAGLSLVGRQKLSLEGDFDSNFALYCPEGYERDALYIFAPDLMQLLIETTAGCDVEFADDAMYVYSAPGRYCDAAAIENLVRVAERVQGKLQRQTGKYADERSAPLTGVASQLCAASQLSGASSGTIAAPRTVSGSVSPTASRTVSPEDHAAGAGKKVGADGQRLRTKTTVLQKLVTVGTTLLLAVAAIYTVIYYLPTLLNR